MSLAGYAPTWTTVGLLYDIVGAILLAFAIFLNSPTKIADQTGTYYDRNLFAAKALAEQTVDARIGLIILVTGFVLQIVGQWRTSGEVYPLVCLLLLILFIVGYFAFFRGCWTNHLVSQVEARGKNNSLQEEQG